MILGTTQLGMPYGINNTDGQPNKEEALRILEAAYGGGIRVLDTAPAYGNCEEVIGEFHKTHSERFDVCTKLPVKLNLEDENGLFGEVEAALNDSIARLSTDSIFCCFLHRFYQCKSKALMDALMQLKDNGVISDIGIAVYHIDELEYICENLKGIVDVVQLPLNVLTGEKWNKAMNSAQNCGIKLYARSIFLQGLLFMDSDAEQVQKLNAGQYLAFVQAFAERRGETVAQLCYDAVNGNQFIDDMMLGCETMEQIRDDLSLIDGYKPLNASEKKEIEEHISDVPDYLLDPSVWSDYL